MSEEMYRFYQDEDLDYTYIEGSTPSLDQLSYSSIPDDNDPAAEPRTQTIESIGAQGGVQTSGTQSHSSVTQSIGTAGGAQTSDLSGVGVNTANQAGQKSISTVSSASTSETALQTYQQSLNNSISTQESGGYSRSFEQNVMAILQGLNQDMARMKSNPTVTKNEIHQQEKVQNEMIQSMITMSLHDPKVMQSLLAMLKGQESGTSSRSRRNSTAFEELETKLLLAQEEQRRETKEHFHSQAEFQATMQKRLEEQAQLQMQGFQNNFEAYAKKLQDQLTEQQKRWDTEMARREEAKSGKKRKKSKSKKHHKSKPNGSSESSSSDSDDGLVQMTAKAKKSKGIKLPAIKTMQAKIYTQELFDDDMRTDSQISIAKIKEKQEARGRLLRKDTIAKFDDSNTAFKKFEAHDEEDEEDDDDDDGEMMQFKHIRPVTLKRAEIKIQSGTGFTPARPAPGPVNNTSGRMGQIRRIELGNEPVKQEYINDKGAGSRRRK